MEVRSAGSRRIFGPYESKLSRTCQREDLRNKTIWNKKILTIIHIHILFTVNTKGYIKVSIKDFNYNNFSRYIFLSVRFSPGKYLPSFLVVLASRD